MAADELGIDPVEIRKQQLHPARALPVHARSPAVQLRHRRVREGARRGVPRRRLRRRCAPSRRRAATAATRSCSASACAPTSRSRAGGLFSEYGSVEMNDDGTVTATVGTRAHGQGHETTFAMIITELLGVPMDDVRARAVRHRRRAARHAARWARARCRSAGARCASASEEVLAKAKQLAAHLLEANPDDIVARRRRGSRSPAFPRAALVVGRARVRRRRTRRGARRLGGRARARARLQPGRRDRSRSVRTSRSSRSTATPDGSS